MCRVVLMNKQGEKEIEKIYGLEKYLKYLEKQLGGHGNGYSLLKNNKVIKLEKGVNLDVRDIAKTLINTDYDWALFHTRFASIGAKCNQNCHPFKRKNIILAMNGTEHSVSFLSKVTEITDTEAILETMSKYNLGLAALRNFSSIFMGFYNGKPFVVADNITNIKILKNKKTNAIVFASSFPSKFSSNIYEVNGKFTWYNGKLPNCLIKYKKRYFKNNFFDDYIYHTDLYEQCYLDVLEKGECNNGL